MPLSEDLLNPIPGDNPSGRNLRYVVYDAIKEARREDDEAPQGDWARERKKADYRLVLRLSCDALAALTKDLQLAAWATEASLKLEGLPGLRRGLDFLQTLIETFWDNVYPELEDGSAEARAGILESLAGKSSELLWYVPITHDGLNWLQYKESRTIGYENDAADNEDKLQARERAITDGKITAEMFDSAVYKSPAIFYEQQVADTEACLASLEALNQVCGLKFGDDRPSFSKLRDGLEDVHHCVSTYLQRKREEQGQVTPQESSEDVATSEDGSAADGESDHAIPEPSSGPPRISKVPEDPADAFERIVLAAHYLRRQQPWDPVPYLVLRALRWGELRASVGAVDSSQLEAPPTEARKRLRVLYQNGEWDELLDATEEVMGTSSGRGWLDLQRYIVKACEGLGDSYTPVSSAIISELKALLDAYPGLSQIALNDETPSANPETQAWLEDFCFPKDRPFEETAPSRKTPESPGQAYVQPVDAYDLAKRAASSGHPQDAIEILEREAAQERSGRGRFQRKMQLAQVCMSTGYKSIALPILDALAEEIDKRNLEEWEDPDLVIQALGLLYQCIEKHKGSAEQKDKVYARICRLGPAQALELAK